jgi:hypothetical protein
MNKGQLAVKQDGASASSSTTPNRSDTKWKIADLVVKGIGAALIGGDITLVGHWFDVQQHNAANENARVRAIIEFASNQKTFDANVDMKLLEKFFDHYLQEKGSIGTPAELDNMLVLLRLITLNFQDVPINLKPLFQDLDQRLAKSKTVDLPNLRANLRQLAQEAARRQAFRVSYLGGILSKPRNLRPNEEASFGEEGIPFTVRLIALQPDSAEIEVRLDDGDGGRRYGPIHASVFDVPLVDNIKVDGDTRLSVLLDRVGDHDVTIRVVSFIADLATDRFDIKEMTRELYTHKR